MDEHCQKHEVNLDDLLHGLHHMSIASRAFEIAGGASLHPSPIFLNPDEAFHIDEPPPLCSCGLDVCVCLTTSEPGHVKTDPMVPLSSNPAATRPCGCSCHVQEISGEIHLTTTHLVIMSAIQQLQGNTPYGAMPFEVQERVLKTTDISEAEYIRVGLCWLLEEAYIMSPLDDGRLMIVK